MHLNGLRMPRSVLTEDEVSGAQAQRADHLAGMTREVACGLHFLGQPLVVFDQAFDAGVADAIGLQNTGLAVTKLIVERKTKFPAFERRGLAPHHQRATMLVTL